MEPIYLDEVDGEASDADKKSVSAEIVSFLYIISSSHLLSDNIVVASSRVRRTP